MAFLTWTGTGICSNQIKSLFPSHTKNNQKDTLPQNELLKIYRSWHFTFYYYNFFIARPRSHTLFILFLFPQVPREQVRRHLRQRGRRLPHHRGRHPHPDDGGAGGAAAHSGDRHIIRGGRYQHRDVCGGEDHKLKAGASDSQIPKNAILQNGSQKRQVRCIPSAETCFVSNVKELFNLQTCKSAHFSGVTGVKYGCF